MEFKKRRCRCRELPRHLHEPLFYCRAEKRLIKRIDSSAVLACLVFGLTLSASGQTTNSWTNSLSSKWETAGNWSAGAPAISHSANLITNAGTKTVTLDSTTAGGGTMTISNLVVSGTGGQNIVQITGPVSAPLRVLNALSVGAGGVVLAASATVQVENASAKTNLLDGTLSVAGGALVVSNSLMILGSVGGVTGNVDVSNGSLLCSNVFIGSATNSAGRLGVSNCQVNITNLTVTVGRFGRGEFIASNSTLRTRGINVSNGDGGSGAFTLVNSTNFMTGSLLVGVGTNSSGSVWIVDGSMLTNIVGMTIGFNNSGMLTVSNSSIFVRGLTFGFTSSTSASGTFVNSTIIDDGNFVIANGLSSTAAVTIVGSQLNVGTNLFAVGFAGDAQLTASNSTIQGGNLYIGTSVGGTLNLQSAIMTALFDTWIGFGGEFSTSAVWMTGSSTLALSRSTTLGYGGVGRLVLSNGMLVASNLLVGVAFPDRGTLTVVGGTAWCSTALVIGDCATNGTGQVILRGGVLAVTNAAHNAVLDVRGGTFTMSGGTLLVDKLVMTNICGRFVKAGGVLQIESRQLDPAFDADGDGIPNASDLDPLDAADAGQDADGDGFTNLQEFQAGTSPTNSASFFGISSVTQVSTNILVTWQIGPGKTNALERSGGNAGNFTNANFSTVFIATNNTASTATNYTDVGAATNVPAFYYRVRLVP